MLDMLYDGRGLNRFLKILQLLIDNSGGQDRPFLPSIISFAMNQIYPSIAEVKFGVSHQI